MDTQETKLTDAESERLVFIVDEIAHLLTAQEREALLIAIEKFARTVASRVYLTAEYNGMKKAFVQEQPDMDSVQ